MIKLTQTIDSLILDNAEGLAAIEIEYTGSLVGEVLGNTISGISKKKIIIAFLSPSEESVMNYYGNFKIISIKAYNNSNPVKITLKVVTDNIDSIKSKWSASTTTYENYNRTNKYIGNQKSILLSRLNGEKRYLDIKGEVAEDKLKSNQRNILNRIRSIK